MYGSCFVFTSKAILSALASYFHRQAKAVEVYIMLMIAPTMADLKA
jgi:hypothetical protein